MVGFGIDGPLHRLDCASSTADDKDSLPFGVLAVKLGRVEDLSVEFLLVWQLPQKRPTELTLWTVSEIPQVIKTLTQSPSAQQRALETYFTPTASFKHPFCRTGS